MRDRIPVYAWIGGDRPRDVAAQDIHYSGPSEDLTALMDNPGMYAFANGTVAVPEGPDLGVEIDEAAVRKVARSASLAQSRMVRGRWRTARMVSRSVIVTGGMGGIGLAVAQAFAPECASITLGDARADTDGIYATLEAQGAKCAIAAAPGRKLRTILQERRFRRVLLIGVVLAVLQQWCGINVVFNYAQEIFASAGYAVSDTLLNIVMTGIVNCVFTLVALGTIERWSRRRLLLLLVTALPGLGHDDGARHLGRPVGDLPGRGARGSMAVATTTVWAACLMLTYTFALPNASAGTGMTFCLYAVICLAGFAFIRKQLPATRGKTLEEIERGWR